ncbi:MAG: hypothetical protein ISP10_00315, partial [Aeromicrobium sp.]|nr:hypothetical protein [Aeromicrobium sp.]
MRKGIRITILLAATVCMLGLFATTAYGYTGWWTPCYSCHAGAPSAATITTNVGANDGTYADFGVTVSGATEWALFAGYTKIATYSGNTTITVPAGANYDIYAVGGSPTSGSFASAAINPAGTYPDPTGDVTAPVSSSNAVASYAEKAEITITATDDQAGVQRIYYRINGGTVRTTPVGVVDGYAKAIVRPTSAGTFNYTISFWAEDREGNIESPQTASFSITRSGTESVAQAGPLTTLGPNGMSQWSYQDLADSTPKYEGGYAAYGGVSGYYADPHGGYDTTTNKCKVCHAVHRAEGAYYLLRADSQDDACDYC